MLALLALVASLGDSKKWRVFFGAYPPPQIIKTPQRGKAMRLGHARTMPKDGNGCSFQMETRLYPNGNKLMVMAMLAWYVIINLYNDIGQL